MVETIEHRSPGIAVIVLQYVFIEIQAVFISYLIVTHVAPPKTRFVFCHTLLYYRYIDGFLER
jgi:hypothetical protein